MTIRPDRARMIAAVSAIAAEARSAVDSRQYTVDTPHAICMACGHYRMLHGLWVECEACDTPEVPIEKRCAGFQIERSL